eukprot:401293_1
MLTQNIECYKYKIECFKPLIVDQDLLIGHSTFIAYGIFVVQFTAIIVAILLPNNESSPAVNASTSSSLFLFNIFLIVNGSGFGDIIVPSHRCKYCTIALI